MEQRSTRKAAARRARVVISALSVGLMLCAANTPARAVPTVDELMADFDFSKDDVQRVRNGELVKTSTKETSERELAVVMVFLVKTPVQKLLASLKGGPSSRYDSQIQAVTEISAEGAFVNPKAVVLQPGSEKETKRYLGAEPGDELNLSTAEIATFAAAKGAGQPQVEDAVRQMLLARYQAYRSQGLAGIAPYARGKDKQSQPADDLRRATGAAKGLKKYAPAFYEVLMNYPQGTPPDLTQQFFCIRYAMSGRPNFALRQRLAMPLENAYVLADRDFYVSHEYNDTQAIGALLPVESGTVVMYLNRTTTDQLGGFGASAKQAIGRNMMAKQLSEIFEKARAGVKGQ